MKHVFVFVFSVLASVFKIQGAQGLTSAGQVLKSRHAVSETIRQKHRETLSEGENLYHFIFSLTVP